MNHYTSITNESITGNIFYVLISYVGVRLEDSAANFTGRVEIFYNGEWGTVCSDGFDQNDAAVVCRQAGYGPPVHYWIDPSHRRHGRIWLDDLQCNGTENTLSECQSSTWGDTNCDHTQDIFIECVGMYICVVYLCGYLANFYLSTIR